MVGMRKDPKVGGGVGGTCEVTKNQTQHSPSDFGSSDVASFDSSDVASFGSRDVASFGSSDVASFGSSDVVSFGSSDVASFGSCDVASFGSSDVASFGSCDIASFGSSDVASFGSSDVANFGSITMDNGNSGKICLKSPPKTTTFPANISESFVVVLIISPRLLSSASKQNLCDIGASSHIINFVCFSNPASSEP
ncbi:hypothetical protein Lal_00035506 [Lupinus albus]|nr:hypothetical protein Lal_00035506 [Lupinus albus]